MMRLIFFCFCIISLTLTSCNNHEAKSGNEIPAKEKQLRDLVKHYPDSLTLRNKLVDYFADNSDFDNAIKETNFIIQKDSNNAVHWDAKARLLFLNEDTLGAISAFKKAVEIYPDPQYVFALGTLYAQKSNPLAISTADVLLQGPEAKDKLQAQFIKGLYYNYSGDKSKAISFFDKCLSIDYTFMDAYREKAIALYDMGKYDDALLLLEKATTVKRTFDEAWYWMGRCYEKSGKRKEAIESYRLALQIDPAYVEAKEALGRLGVSN
ncbi:MAG: tetratricopeptide repeat protein [Ferruginibacter sp.]